MEQQKKVTTIPASISKFTAAPIDKPVKRKVAGYARVSTDHDEQLTSEGILTPGGKTKWPVTTVKGILKNE